MCVEPILGMSAFLVLPSDVAACVLDRLNDQLQASSLYGVDFETDKVANSRATLGSVIHLT
jgi:hypothetical protein